MEIRKTAAQAHIYIAVLAETLKYRGINKYYYIELIVNTKTLQYRGIKTTNIIIFNLF